MIASSRARVVATRRTKQEWQAIFADQEISGLTTAQYCKKHDLVLSTFYSWQKKMCNLPQAQLTDDFIEVPAAHFDVQNTFQASASHWDVELDLGNGVCLRIRQPA
jgi:putative transposase